VSERLRDLSDERLGAAIAALQVEWPPQPDLAPGVLAAIAAPPTPRAIQLPLRRRTRVLLIAAATVLLLAGAAVAAKLVIDLGAVVVRVTESPGTLPLGSPPPMGEPIDLVRAGALQGEPPAVPATLGPPDRVWADRVTTEAGEVVRITLAWDVGADLPPIPGTGFGAVLMRFQGDTNTAFKDVYQDTGRFSSPVVGGREAYWTTGSHRLTLLTAEGIVTVRVDGNVLLWPDEPFTFRLETALPKAAAIRIAESIPGTS
jgi:hypothetical protein